MASILRSALQLVRRRAPSPPRRGRRTVQSYLLSAYWKYEEETLAWYEPGLFYPVRLWDVFRERYQVICKLGYGTSSTVWLCRDLVEHEYVSIKISERDSPAAAREREVYTQMNTVTASHDGALNVRKLLDTFELRTTWGTFICLVHKPLDLRLSDYQAMCPDSKLPRDILKLTLTHILLGLDYLHSKCHVIHADLQTKNILLHVEDNKVLEELERAELDNPSPCKVVGDRIIYLSRNLPAGGGVGRPTICDFGEARICGRECSDDIQPYLYRAPEVILEIPWGEKVDIWNLGVLAWDLSFKRHLFNAEGPRNGSSSVRHIAEMIAVLGPPPTSFLQRSEAARRFFDDRGNWKGEVDIPDQSLESLEENLDGPNNALFMDFMRKMLRWVPEERSSAAQLLEHPWLRSS